MPRNRAFKSPLRGRVTGLVSASFLAAVAVSLARQGVAAAQPASDAPPAAPTSAGALPPPPPPSAAPPEGAGTKSEPAAPEAPAAGGASPVPPKDVEYDLLTFYKDNYFIAGFTDSTEVKLQVSAKFDLWPNETQHAVHFAFTAKSLWNLYKRSAPFVENNYNPEIFYTYFHHEGRYDPPPGCGFFSERLGLEHESNGEDAPKSRGWNRVYVESRFACYSERNVFATVSLKVWAPPFGTSDNPGITDHLGYGELGLSVGSEGRRNWWGDGDVSVVARKGTNRGLDEGSVEIAGRWRPSYAGFWRFTPYLFTQVFAGYGETLLTYDRSLTAFRIGFGLSDRSTRSK